MQSDVSVVIPAYNAAHYIASAIESALAQTTAPREIIVIDDGSTDDTRAIVERFGGDVRYVIQQNRGVSAARNNGIDQSRSKYVAFLDADDTWLPVKIERQIAALNAAQGRASYTAHLVVDDRSKPLFVNRSERHLTSISDLLTKGNVVGSPSSVLCERSLFAEVGKFDTAFSLCADWEMWIRIATVTEFVPVDEPLVKYRVHGDNMSLDVSLLEDDSLRTLRKGFALAALPPAVRGRRRTSFAHNYMVLAGSYARAQRPLHGLRCALESLVRDPRQTRELLAYFARRAAGRSGERSVAQHPATRSADR